MGKKVYHIVDPETGEIVGEKRVGRIGQADYKTPPKGRALFVLALAPAFLMLASAVLCVLSFFMRGRMISIFGSLVIINAVLGVLLIFLWSVIDEHCSTSSGEGEDEHHDT